MGAALADGEHLAGAEGDAVIRVIGGAAGWCADQIALLARLSREQQCPQLLPAPDPSAPGAGSNGHHPDAAQTEPLAR